MDNFHSFINTIYGKFWRIETAWHIFLQPLCWIYYLSYFIKYNILSFPKKISKPVICVGNITVGGAGKTEVALALGRLCLKLKLRPAFIAHGYNSKYDADEQYLVDSMSHTSEEVGDEALLLSQLAPTYLSKNRIKAAKAAAKEADILIFDDGMQNNTFRKDIVFNVINSEYLFGNGMMMPLGPLREPISSGFAKTDYFVFTYCDDVMLNNTKVMDMINAIGKPIFYLKTEILNSKQIQNKSFVVMAGIANPENFLKTLKSLNVIVTAQFLFADHHQYTTKDLEHVCMVATTHNVKIVTTAKDMMRIPKRYHPFIEVVRLYSDFHTTKDLSNLISGLANHSVIKNN